MEVLYEFHGIVQQGNKRGKTLGFPTINIPLSFLIPEGIYYAYASIDHTLYPALTMIGTVKTYHEIQYHSETYILDFDGQLYGQDITIQLLEKFRENMEFKTESELINAMKEDKRKASLFFHTNR